MKTQERTVEQYVADLVLALDAVESETFAAKGYTHQRDYVTASTRKKYIAIDIGTSGAWLVEIATGEIFNIKGYGVADRNKKAKSDIGNVATVDPRRMHAMRYNYLR